MFPLTSCKESQRTGQVWDGGGGGYHSLLDDPEDANYITLFITMLMTSSFTYRIFGQVQINQTANNTRVE